MTTPAPLHALAFVVVALAGLWLALEDGAASWRSAAAGALLLALVADVIRRPRP